MPPGEDPSIVTELEVCKIEWGSNYGYYVRPQPICEKTNTIKC